MKYNLKNETKYDLSVVENLISDFFPYAQRRLGFNKPVDVKLKSDLSNSENPLGKTAYYNPQMMEIAVFVDKRHPKDILRSFSHELVHHTQNCRGEFDRDMNIGDGYTQTDEHMRGMEEEAYLEGQMILRDWEDTTIKEGKKMSKVNLEEAVREAVQAALRGVLSEDNIKEEEVVEEEETLEEKELEESQNSLEEEEINEEESLEEEELTEEELAEEEVVEEELYEHFTSQKNKMLFENLVKKWAK